MQWLNTNQVAIEPPKKFKKVTGTRFASILGHNPWSTEFEMWCAITKTYEIPFEDTIYTIAGKTIEPKQAEYMRQYYGMDIVTPTDVYGQDYFKKTWGDFFRENLHFGGMWDYLVKDSSGKVTRVLEMKTSKRVEDWENGVPEYYALQAALYAWLLGVDDVTMVASFLESGDYEKPEEFVPSCENTITVSFKVSERYPDFAEKIAYVENWWKNHVDTGISPVYNEKRDAEILKALRTAHPKADDCEITKLMARAESLKKALDEVAKSSEEMAKEFKSVCDAIRDFAIASMPEGAKYAELDGPTMKFLVTKTTSTSIDKDALRKDGLLEKYQKQSDSYRMTVK